LGVPLDATACIRAKAREECKSLRLRVETSSGSASELAGDVVCARLTTYENPLTSEKTLQANAKRGASLIARPSEGTVRRPQPRGASVGRDMAASKE